MNIIPKEWEFLLTRPSRDVTGSGAQADGSALFLLTRPSRDVTENHREQMDPEQFLLTRPSRDVTIVYLVATGGWEISTHTSLTGRDQRADGGRPEARYFYSHVPHGT